SNLVNSASCRDRNARPEYNSRTGGCDLAGIMRKISFGLALLMCVGPASRVAAQATTSSVVGAVKDQTAAVLPGAAITAKHLETGLVRNATTESDGRYVLVGMPLGAYE